MEKENILQKNGISFHRKLSFKLVIIGVLILILLIPKFMILGLINERKATSNQVIGEVMDKWSNSQQISGPILHIPFKTRTYDEKKKEYKESLKWATFLPKELKIEGELIPRKLKRSIYEVYVYESVLNITGKFQDIDLQKHNIKPENIIWEAAQIQMGVSDLRGIGSELLLNWNDKTYTFSPGKKNSAIGRSGISIPLEEIGIDNLNGKFDIKLNLKGSKNLMFTPLGENTLVSLKSNWNDPGFIGNFLPKDRDINKNGFQAKWSITHFNRNYPQQWISVSGTGLKDDIKNSAFGVEMVTLADHYQKNTRSAKYAVLIIIITFLVFFMYEVFSNNRIHPFQYILVGCAIIIFYLLLLSISEHLGFDLAYLVASLSVILLVFFYTSSFMEKLKNKISTSIGLATCYAFVFVLLQLESYALLAGSIGLFALLSLLMYSTRKVNWYKE